MLGPDCPVLTEVNFQVRQSFRILDHQAPVQLEIADRGLDQGFTLFQGASQCQDFADLRIL